MVIQKKKKIIIEFGNTSVDILIDISIKLSHIEIALALVLCILTILVSSLDEQTRIVWTDLLLWILRALSFGERH